MTVAEGCQDSKARRDRGLSWGGPLCGCMGGYILVDRQGAPRVNFWQKPSCTHEVGPSVDSHAFVEGIVVADRLRFRGVPRTGGSQPVTLVTMRPPRKRTGSADGNRVTRDI